MMPKFNVNIKEVFGRFAGKSVIARDSLDVEKLPHYKKGALFAMPSKECPVLKDLSEAAGRHGMTVRLEPLFAHAYRGQAFHYNRLIVPLERRGKDHWVISDKMKIG